MPEPVQRPATDDQLRMAADRAATRWIDETERALRDRWASRPVDAPLAGIAVEERRRWWGDHLREYAHQRIVRWRDAARRSHRDITEQAFAQLRVLEPRFGEQELGRPGPDLLVRLTDVVTATAAASPHADESRAIDAALVELAVRAVVLEEMRSGKTAELTLALRELSEMLASARELESATAQPGDPKRMVLEPHLAARDALRRRIPDVRRIGDESDRALLPDLDAAVLDQCMAVVAQFRTARSTAAAVLAEMPAVLKGLDTAAAGFDARFGDAETLKKARRHVEFHGPAAVLALCALTPEAAVGRALAKLAEPGQEAAFRAACPAGSTQDQLLTAYRQAARSERKVDDGKGGYQREDRVNSAQ
ncbi:hypothetical protein OG216_38935 [Streptomycetaceae bacterium NBC_01309]